MLQQSVADLSTLAPSALIEFFTIDASAPEIGANAIVHVTNHINADGSSIVWQGTTYSPYPCAVESVQMTSSGAADEPSFQVSNVTGIFSALCVTYQDLIGAKVTRKRVLAKYLDGQPLANTSAGLPDDIWYIKQKKSESRSVVQWLLSNALDLDNVQIPRMRVNCNFCQVRYYRGAECGYTGTTVFTDKTGAALNGTTNRGLWSVSNSYALHDYFYVLYHNVRFYYVCVAAAAAGTPVTNTAHFTPDVCTRQLDNGCAIRFGASNQLPFLGFPGTLLLPQ